MLASPGDGPAFVTLAKVAAGGLAINTLANPNPYWPSSVSSSARGPGVTVDYTLKGIGDTGGYGIATDRAGDIYYSSGNQVFRLNASNGVVNLVAGNGTAGFSGDGAPATAAELNGPGGVAVDGAGNVYIADNWNQRVRKVDTSGVITTLAGERNGRL